MAGKTNESIAHKVLPTNEANTPNSGTNEAITASPTTTIARLMHMQIFPGPVESLLFLKMILSFPSTISLIGCNMIGSVNASPTHNPTWHHTKCYINTTKKLKIIESGLGFSCNLKWYSANCTTVVDMSKDKLQYGMCM